MGEAGESERGGLRVGGKYSGESFFFFFLSEKPLFHLILVSINYSFPSFTRHCK